LWYWALLFVISNGRFHHDIFLRSRSPSISCPTCRITWEEANNLEMKERHEKKKVVRKKDCEKEMLWKRKYARRRAWEKERWWEEEHDIGKAR
jgi:hypothetical protein